MTHHPMNPVSVYRLPWVCHIKDPDFRDFVETFNWGQDVHGHWLFLYDPKYMKPATGKKLEGSA